MKIPEYKYDLFIAYHGTHDPNGSYEEAKKIKKFLQNKYKVYLFEEEEGYTWAETPKKIIESKAMLMVLGDNVILDGNELLVSEINVNGQKKPYQLYVEYSEFKSCVDNGSKSPQSLNLIYCGKQYSGEQARSFCEKQAVGIASLNNVIGSDCYNDGSAHYEIIEDWLKMALLIQKNWDEQHLEEIKNVKLEDLFSELQEEMFSQNCVAVVGPELNEFLLSFSAAEGKTFYQKCKDLYDNGENHLFNALKNQMPDKTTIPIHIKHLVRLPFTAYITTDEYSCICEALGEKGFKVGFDLSTNFDLQHGSIPVFQFKRSKIWKDDCLPEGNENEVLLKTLIKQSGRRIIYLGFSDDYEGYKSISKYLRSILGDGYFTAHNNIAFVSSKINPKLFISSEERLTIVNMSGVEFIDKMISSNDLIQRLFTMNQGDNVFITDLFNIASTPTETEAIELLIKQLNENISSANISVKDIVEKFNSNVAALKKLKPNFNAFEKCWFEIRDKLEEDDDLDSNDFQTIVSRVMLQRSEVSSGIKKQGKTILSNKSITNVLLFSQSLRVVEFLIGANKDFRKNCNIYICECRPKSDIPFRDARNMCEKLTQFYSNITIIPDMAAFNLMNRKMIDCVILGAHDVVFYNNNPISFINTCGTSALLSIAKENQIQVSVIAENGKFTKAKKNKDTNQLEYMISYGHESTIYKDFDFVLWAKKQNILTKNIGYDYCKFYRGVEVISEDKHFVCDENADVEVKLIDTSRRA